MSEFLLKVSQHIDATAAVLRKFYACEDGTSAVEYTVMLALIVVFCIFSIEAVGLATYDALWDAVEALE